jgi:hypothetical protein
MHYSVPFRFWGRDDLGESRIRQSVSEAGLELTSFGNSEKQPYGIVAFSEMNQELVSLIRALRRGTAARVLALAVRASVLRSGDVWRLLQAGAADVMEWIGESVAQPIDRQRHAFHCTAWAI